MKNLSELVTDLERRAVEAERVQAQAPVAAVLNAVLEDLRAVDGAAPGPAISAAPDSAALEEYLTPEQVEALLQVPKGYAYNHKRELGGVRVGKYLRFLKSGVRRRLERQR